MGPWLLRLKPLLSVTRPDEVLVRLHNKPHSWPGVDTVASERTCIDARLPHGSGIA